jgi:Family of unknown function (DUF5677)
VEAAVSATQLATDMTSTVSEWTALAERLGTAAMEIFRSAEVAITSSGFADEKVLVLALLARSLSNLKGVLVLLRARRIVEARTITRCCLENFYWTVALSEKGDKFVRQMLHEEMSRRKARGQFIFQSEIELDAAIEGRLRGWLKDANQRFAGAKSLNPKDVASVRADFAKTYTFYSQLSSDAAHPSVDALNRYVVPHTEDEVGGIDVEPVVKDTEIAETIEYLCMAFMGVCVGVNQMLGGTTGGTVLPALADEYTALSNRTKAENE